MAAWIICSWLILRDATVLDRKKALARSYLADVLPKIRVSGAVVLESSAEAYAVKKSLLE